MPDGASIDKGCATHQTIAALRFMHRGSKAHQRLSVTPNLQTEIAPSGNPLLQYKKAAAKILPRPLFFPVRY
jgi:hypothetical protein